MPKQSKSPIRQEFAKRLRSIRIDHRPGDSTLTQSAFAKLLTELGKDKDFQHQAIHVSTVGHWENYRVNIEVDERALLTNIIRAFYKKGHITTLDQANELLATGRYARLSEEEIRRVEPTWLSEALYLYANVESRIPVLQDYLGLTSQAAGLLSTIINSDIQTHVLFGLTGSGKSALARLSVDMIQRDMRFGELVPVIWHTVNPTVELSPEAHFDRFVRYLWQQLFDRSTHLRPQEEMELQISARLAHAEGLLVIDGLTFQNACDYFCQRLARIYSGRTLITSRFSTSYHAANNIPVRPLSDIDAARLLKRQFGDSSVQVPDVAIKSINKLAGNPLSIILVGNALRQGKDFETIIYEIHHSKWHGLDSLFAKVGSPLTETQVTILLCFQLLDFEGVDIETVEAITRLKSMVRPVLYSLAKIALIQNTAGLFQVQPMVHQFTAHTLQFDDELQAKLSFLCGNALSHWHLRIQECQIQGNYGGIDSHRASVFETVHQSLHLVSRLLPEAKLRLAALARSLFHYVYRYGHAHEWLPLLREITERLDNVDNATRVRLLTNLGLIARINRNLPLAYASHNEARILAEEIESVQEMAYASINIGVCCEMSGTWPEAHHHAMQALSLFTSIGDESGIAACYNLLGMIELQSGNFEQAEYQFSQAVKYFQQTQGYSEAARSYSNLALAQSYDGKFRLAEVNFRMAESHARNDSNEQVKLRIAVSKATMYLEQFEKKRIAIGKRKAFDILKDFPDEKLYQLGEPGLHAEFLGKLGRAQLLLQQYDLAQQTLTLCVKMWKDVGSDIDLASALLSLAECRIRLRKMKLVQQAFDDVALLIEDNSQYFLAGRLRSQLNLLRSHVESSQA